MFRLTAKEIVFILLFFSLLFLPPLFWDLTRGRGRKGTELHANWKKREGEGGGSCLSAVKDSRRKERKTKITLVQRCVARSQCRKCTPVLRIVVLRTLPVKKLHLALYTHFYRTWLVCTLSAKTSGGEELNLTSLQRGKCWYRVRIYVLVQTVIVAAAMQKFTSYISRSFFWLPSLRHIISRDPCSGGDTWLSKRRKEDLILSSSFLQVQSSKLYHGECSTFPLHIAT